MWTHCCLAACWLPHDLWLTIPLLLGRWSAPSAQNCCLAARQLLDAEISIPSQVSEQYAEIARGWWKKAGVEDKVDLMLGLASESVGKLIEEGKSGTYDLAFIDAGEP